MKIPMTRQRIEQYPKLQKEIAAIEEQLFSLENFGGEYVSDVVSGSSPGPSYGKCNIVIKGYGSQRIPQLRERMASKVAECNAIEKYIDSIDDSLMWQLLTRRYIEGRTLAETADLVGYSQSHAGRLINDFLKRRCPMMSNVVE